MEKILEDLAVMEQLFRKYDLIGIANLMVKYAKIYQDDRSLFWSKVNSIDWWGGSGSIADINLYRDDMVISNGERKADNRKLRAALISIYREMSNTGYQNERAKSWVEIFMEWERNQSST